MCLLSDNNEQSIGESSDQQEPRWPADEKSRLRRLEAVLFMARSPLNTRKISQLAELEDGTQARTMIKQLNQHYDRVQRAFHVKRVAGGYQLRTRPQFADWIRRQDHIPNLKANRLSAPAQETLTVVAYRQPIIKADIEAIRGVSCGEMLRQLLEKGLLKIAGRSEQLGRPFLYATTKEFLTEFGLTSLNGLPKAKQLSGTGLPDWMNSEKNDAHDSPSTHSQPDVSAIEPPIDQSHQEEEE